MRRTFEKLITGCAAIAALLAGVEQASYAGFVVTNTFTFASNSGYNPVNEAQDGGDKDYSIVSTPGDPVGAGFAFAQNSVSGNTISISTGASAFGQHETLFATATGVGFVTFDQLVHDATFTLTVSSVVNNSGDANDFVRYELDNNAFVSPIVSGYSYGGVQTVSGSLQAGGSYMLKGISMSSMLGTNDGNNSGYSYAGFTLTINEITSPVPEPTSLALMGFGGISLVVGAYLRRRRREASVGRDVSCVLASGV